jgi:hypothetical protein
MEAGTAGGHRGSFLSSAHHAIPRCPQIASEGLKGRVFEVCLADLQKVRRWPSLGSRGRRSRRYNKVETARKAARSIQRSLDGFGGEQLGRSDELRGVQWGPPAAA